MANPVKMSQVLSRIKGYKDPATKRIEDWSWKPIEEVAQRLDYPTEVPDYIQGGYGQFMQRQLGRAQRGEMGPRDLLKAYGITQSSIGRGGLPYNTATKAGLKVPRTDELVRPEGAFAEWLGSPMGQKYLQSAERGEVNQRALSDIQEKFAPFGKQNQLIGQMAYGATELPKMGDVNKALLSDSDRFRKWASSIKGIDSAKPGFIGSLLGRGDVPTLDARQLNLQANTPPVGIGSIMKRGKGTGGLEAVDRLTARQKALALDIDPSLDPFYQHLAHHTLWDKMGGAQTTHADLVKAMKDYKEGGPVNLAKGGDVFKEMVKAYKLFRRKTNDPETLYPLFVNANKPVPVGEWLQAEVGPLSATGKVKSKLGELAYRPGWHAGDLPIATHIGAKSNPNLKAPDLRPPEQVWAEVDMPADVNWQKIANERAQRNKSGLIIPRTAHITDEIPFGGHYRYKTSPNMEGNWLISGDMRVNRVLSDEEVRAINEASGTYDLPRYSPLKKADGGLAQYAKGGKTAAWQRKEGKNPEGGLNAKGRASYHAETGGTLKRPQPEGGARRDSFCSRMSGMKKKLTSAKTANDPDSRINKALRKWNC